MNSPYLPYGLVCILSISAIRYHNRFHPDGWLIGHDPHEFGCVRYTLHPLTVVPPRGPFHLSNLFVIAGEGHLICFPVICPLAWLKSCLVEASRQLNPLLHQRTILGERVALAGQPAAVCYSQQVYNSWYTPTFTFRIPTCFSWGLQYVSLVTCRSPTLSIMFVWSDKEISCDPYQLVTRPPVLSVPSAKSVTPFLLLITIAGPLPNLEC